MQCSQKKQHLQSAPKPSIQSAHTVWVPGMPANWDAICKSSTTTALPTARECCRKEEEEAAATKAAEEEAAHLSQVCFDRICQCFDVAQMVAYFTFCLGCCFCIPLPSSLQKQWWRRDSVIGFVFAEICNVVCQCCCLSSIWSFATAFQGFWFRGSMWYCSSAAVLLEKSIVDYVQKKSLHLSRACSLLHLLTCVPSASLSLSLSLSLSVSYCLLLSPHQTV